MELNYNNPSTKRLQAITAGDRARQARECFLDTVSHFGPGAKESHEALNAWGKAHNEAVEADRQAQG